jgi:hypothetical protein
MASRRTAEQQAREFMLVAARLKNPSQRLMQRILGNAAIIAHNFIRFNFLKSRAATGKPWPKLSKLTLLLKRAAGQGRRRGRGTGRLEKAIGPPITRTGGGRVSDRSFVKWRRTGFRFGENLPPYAKWFSRGWEQKFTKKQAAYITFRVMEAEKRHTGGTRKKRRVKGRAGRQARQRAERHVRKKRSKRGSGVRARQKRRRRKGEGFDFALFKGLLKRRHKSPERLIMHVDNATVDKMSAAINEAIVDFILHPK